MCGIAGMMTKVGVTPSERELTAMTDCILHRGPDDSGNHIDANCALGFRRLSILDLAHGHQPMFTEDNRYAIIFNGEIYNHLDVRKELDAIDSRPWRTTSDTETILRAWEHWQTDALPKLAGMFGMAIWDSLERRLFLARDRAGKKPLFYFAGHNVFLFGSEIKAILTHQDAPREMDEGRIAEWVTYRFLPGKETLFKGIVPLPMGSWISLTSPSDISDPVPYWSYPKPADGTITDEAEAIQAFEEELTKAVATRMIADVPVGAFLSGGLDSSMICALIKKTSPASLKTFSIGFDTGFSEATIAREVSNHLGTDHYEFIASSDDMISVVSDVMWARETPISEPSDLAIFKLSEMARKEVTVVLSGEGSDEILGGYPKYKGEALGERIGFARGILNGVAKAISPKDERKITLASVLAEPDKFERYARWFGAFASSEREPLFDNPPPNVTDYSKRLAKDFQGGSTADLMMYLDFHEWLPANLLLRGDRMTMAHSLELRCPFMDHRVVEHAVSQLPASFRLKGKGGKYPLRALADRYLPAEIRERQKWGFKLPVGSWFRGPWKETFRAVVLAADSPARRWFRIEHVERLWAEHTQHGFDHSKKLWCLFQVVLWHRMFIEQTLQPGEPLPEQQLSRKQSPSV
ncbi:MAG: asparagine synthase (glutamine-hydrolyzing) [Fimbriimonadales bacterium]